MKTKEQALELAIREIRTTMQFAIDENLANEKAINEMRETLKTLNEILKTEKGD